LKKAIFNAIQLPFFMQKNSCLLITLLCITIFSFTLDAQENLPTDYLTKEFHAGRRDAARKMMPAKSVMAVFAYPERNYSNDVSYFFHQNPDMYYFTGYKEPHSLLLIFKEPQTLPDGTIADEVLFVQERNAIREQWDGRRLGKEGVQKKLGIKTALNGKEFKDFAIDFSAFEKIITAPLPSDVRRNRFEEADLLFLIDQFKDKTKMPASLKEDKRFDASLFMQITGGLREVKTPEEMDLIRKAVEISCQGQNEVMKTVKAQMSELEIQGLHEYIHKRYGAESVGYGSIIGAGENGCVLHYMENNKTKVGTDMILMDVGAEYHGYSADVTRTVPVDGKFSDAERAVYQIVYDAQEAAFAILKEGAKMADASAAANKVIQEGLLKLGIIKDAKEFKKYYPHGLGHHIGLDVHDRNTGGPLKKNMVITIEPGIYIPPGSDCDKKWWGLAVRIEDDALITQDGYELLSVFAPRKIEDIEKLMAEKSVLDNYTLPKLKSAEKKAF
jgi:Xaa-Pro aminopeptidase